MNCGFDWMFVLKVALISALAATVYPFVYAALFGRPMKKQYLLHPNIYFRSVAIAINTAVVLIPLLRGVSVYIVLPLALVTYLLLQKISDDYIS